MCQIVFKGLEKFEEKGMLLKFILSGTFKEDLVCKGFDAQRKSIFCGKTEPSLPKFCLFARGFCAISAVFQLFNGDSSQIPVSRSIFNQYFNSPLS